MEKDSFENFRKKVVPEVEFVERLLRRPLADEPGELVADLRRVEVWYARIQTIMAEAEHYLDLAENEHLPSKGKFTELEREKILASRVAPQRFLRDRTVGLAEALKTRILLGQTMLNFYRDLHFSERNRR